MSFSLPSFPYFPSLFFPPILPLPFLSSHFLFHTLPSFLSLPYLPSCPSFPFIFPPLPALRLSSPLCPCLSSLPFPPFLFPPSGGA